MVEISSLQLARSAYRPKLPSVLAENGPFVTSSEGAPTASVSDCDAIARIFPHTYGLPMISFTGGTGKQTPSPRKVGVILSGGQAPGGHNVIAGLYDAVRTLSSAGQVYGFRGGPSGLLTSDCELFTDALVDAYRNTGGFDIIGSGRTKLETEKQFAEVAANCGKLGITALVVIGGDDSNTNACLLAEYFCRNKIDIQVIGCPKTIDGDLKNEQIETSFGFDTATKVYAELIGNIQRDAMSAKKYWHFIKLMGRSASHIALECALKTHPTVTIISEEVAAQAMTLRQVVEQIADIVADRADRGMDFGVVLIPEGLIEFIPEMKRLISELNDLLAESGTYFESLRSTDDKLQFVNSKLSPTASQAFSSLPGDIQKQLMLERDDHGNVPVSKIQTEQLLIDLVGDLLRERKAAGAYSGKFSPQNHFFGYEGRCAAPSNFDADYCYSLGYAAACLVAAGRTGYMACVGNLLRPAAEWVAGGIPLTMMMNIERRNGEEHPVIRKALVELDAAPFLKLASHREAWATGNKFLYPGPIQYFGPAQVCDQPSATLRLERLTDDLPAVPAAGPWHSRCRRGG